MTPTIFHSSKARSCLTERKEIYFPSIYFCWAYVWNSWLANHKKEYKKTCLYICSSRLRPTDIFQLVWRFHFLCTLKNYVSLKFQTRNYIVDLVNCISIHTVLIGLLHYLIWIVSSILDAFVCIFISFFRTSYSVHGSTIIIYVWWRIDHWRALISWQAYKYRPNQTKKYHQPKN